MASWARSSAWVASPVRVRAKARRWGIRVTSSRWKPLSRAGPSRGSASVSGAAIMSAFPGFAVRTPQDVQKLFRHRLVNHLIENLSQLHADGPLPQPRFIERGRTLAPFFHGHLIDHAIGVA